MAEDIEPLRAGRQNEVEQNQIGFKALDDLDAMPAIGSFGNHFEAGLGGKEALQSFTEENLVINNDKGRHEKELFWAEGFPKRRPHACLRKVHSRSVIRWHEPNSVKL